MLTTRFTKAFELDHPIASAPMARAAGGQLAAAVARAGGLGLIGGGYCDPDWIDSQFEAAGNQSVGCGFITWKLAESPDLLGEVLTRKPKAVFLSFGDPAPFVDVINAAGVPLIVQVQTLKEAKHAADLGAAVIVAQGSEAGGHGAIRATLTLVPEVSDMLAKFHPSTLLLAAGGIADGRGLASALMLGADGVLLGTRLWASEEALVHPNMWARANAATGDDTIRTKVIDVARGFDWPEAYTCRVLKNAFSAKWHDDIDGLVSVAAKESQAWVKAWERGDTNTANAIVGEGIGLIDDVQPACKLLEDISLQAERLLEGGWKKAI